MAKTAIDGTRLVGIGIVVVIVAAIVSMLAISYEPSFSSNTTVVRIAAISTFAGPILLVGGIMMVAIGLSYTDPSGSKDEPTAEPPQT